MSVNAVVPLRRSRLTLSPVAGVRHLLRPVRQPAASAGDDRHAGPGDLPRLVASVRRAAAAPPRSGGLGLASDDVTPMSQQIS